MLMGSKSVVFDGDIYFDCLEEFVLINRLIYGPKTSAKLGKSATETENCSSGYSSGSEESLPHWKELAFEELGETAEVQVNFKQFKYD